MKPQKQWKCLFHDSTRFPKLRHYAGTSPGFAHSWCLRVIIIIIIIIIITTIITIIKWILSLGVSLMMKYVAMVEWYWQGKTGVLGEKHYTGWVVDGWMSMEQ